MKMKKILKIIALVIITVMVSVLAIAYVSLSSFSPEDPDIEVDQAKLQYFQKSYNNCRDAFQIEAEELQERYEDVEIFSSNVPSRVDDDLFIDFCFVPAQKESKKLLILTSGLHGLEGFVGSAVQQMIMNELLNSELLEEMGVLFIHGINPYGFRYARRLTENNVDLNRNCDTENAIFSTKNKGYNDLVDMIIPEGKANVGSLKNRFFMLVAINKILQESKAAIRQAVLQGQYEHPNGIYFGGNNFEPQLAAISDILLNYSKDYETVFNIDLHTGWGERGTAHLFPNPIDDTKVKTTLENIFEGYSINWGDSEDFYIINGSFTNYIGKLLSDKFYLPMMLEYGTLNSQSTVGSVKSLHNSILENQGVHLGYKSPKDSIMIRENFMEMFNPSSEKWRTKIMIDSKTMLKQALENYQNM
jgi:hypothetical protein